MESLRAFVSDNLLFFFLLAIGLGITVIAIVFHFNNIRMGRIMLKKSNVVAIDDDDEGQF